MQSEDETSYTFPGWRVLAAAVIGLAFSPGPMVLAGFGLFVPHFQSAFGANRGAILLSLTLFNVASVIASPFTGRLIDRLGVRAVLLPSLIVSALGFAVTGYFMPSLTVFYAVWFLRGGLSIGTQSISYTKLISGWFVRYRGLAIGIAAAGLGVGYIIVPLIEAQLLSHLSWQSAFAALGLIMVIPFLLNLLLSHPNPSATVTQADEGMTLDEAVRTPEFAIMCGSILLSSVVLTGVVPHITLLALDRGFTPARAAAAAAVYGVSTVFGRVLVGWLADRLFVPRVGAFFFSLSLVGFVLAGRFAASASYGMLVFLSLVIGLGFGAESDLIALLIVRYFGQRSFGAIYGWLFAAFLVGASAGPALFGFGHDHFGTYTIPMMLAAAVMLTAIVLMLALDKTRVLSTASSSLHGTTPRAATPISG
jgi:MFS family permease